MLFLQHSIRLLKDKSVAKVSMTAFHKVKLNPALANDLGESCLGLRYCNQTGKILVQTLLDAQLDLGTQPCYKVFSDHQVRN